jgi:hypothetical protein
VFPKRVVGLLWGYSLARMRRVQALLKTAMDLATNDPEHNNVCV